VDSNYRFRIARFLRAVARSPSTPHGASVPVGNELRGSPPVILREPLRFHQRQIGSGAVERRWRRGVEHQLWSELGEDRA
jgi:hypothetical protein